VLGDEVEPHLVQLLAKARSNLPEHQDGAHLYQKWVRPAFVDLKKVGVHYAIRSLFEPYEAQSQVYCYRVERVAGSHVVTDDNRERKLAVGRANFTSEVTRESETLSFAALDLGDYNPFAGVRQSRGQEVYDAVTQELIQAFSLGDLPEVSRLLREHLGGETYNLTSLFKDEQRQILGRVVAAEWSEAADAFAGVYRHIIPVMRTLVGLGAPLTIPRAFYAVAEFALNTQLLRSFGDEEMSLDKIQKLIADAQAAHVTLDAATLEYTFRMKLESMAERFRAAYRDVQVLKRLDAAAGLVRSLPFEVNLWKVQNICYELIELAYRDFRARAEEGDQEAKAWTEVYSSLAEKFSLRLM